jgi:hypothetical protein
MYKHHEDCGQQIIQLESENDFKMDYIINTREDIYFFKPLDLTSLIGKHMTANTAVGQETNACDLLTKGCLDFGGLNMRLQLLRRSPSGIDYMSKVSFFKQMMKKNKQFENPERFEQYMAEKVLQMRACKLDVEEMAITAARLSYVNLSVCFIHQELKLLQPASSPPCVPRAEMDFAIMHLCPR